MEKKVFVNIKMDHVKQSPDFIKDHALIVNSLKHSQKIS